MKQLIKMLSVYPNPNININHNPTRPYAHWLRCVCDAPVLPVDFHFGARVNRLEHTAYVRRTSQKPMKKQVTLQTVYMPQKATTR